MRKHTAQMIPTNPITILKNQAEETDVKRRPTKRPVTRMFAALGAALALVMMSAAPSFADPTLTVSASTGLKDGQTLTISGSGFAANLQSIAIGQCIVGYVGPKDCNTSGGAQFKNADGSGGVASFTIVVKEKFGVNDCTKVKCVIAASPLPTNTTADVVKANTYEIPMSFGDAAPVAPAAPAAPVAAPVAPVATTMATSALATTSTATVVGPVTPTGSNGAVGFLLLGAGALIAGGAGAMLIQARRDSAGRAS